MIIQTNKQLKIGKVYSGYNWNGTLSDQKGDPHTNFRFLVLKEATKEEFINDLLENGAINLKIVDPFFFEISID